jgi:hypothetical protein
MPPERSCDDPELLLPEELPDEALIPSSLDEEELPISDESFWLLRLLSELEFDEPDCEFELVDPEVADLPDVPWLD